MMKKQVLQSTLTVATFHVVEPQCSLSVDTADMNT